MDELKELLPNSYHEFKDKKYKLFKPPSVKFMKNYINNYNIVTDETFIYGDFTYTISPGYKNFYEEYKICGYLAYTDFISFKYTIGFYVYWIKLYYNDYGITQIRQPLNRGVGSLWYIEDTDQLIAFY